MKKVIVITMSLVLSIANITIAQNLRGGFGHAYFGTVFNLSPDIQNDLKASSLLGSDLQLNRITRFTGGGGYCLLNKRILLGGSGFGYRVDDATSRGEATLSSGGGLVNFGYLIVVNKNIISFPYIGIGGSGMKLKLKNTTSDEAFNLGNKTVSAGRTMTMNSGCLSLEVGYSINLLAFPMEEGNRHSGVMVGLQVGTYLFAGMENWREEKSDDMIANLSNPYSFSPYLRITIGGGSFRTISDK